MALIDRFKSAWNAFSENRRDDYGYMEYGEAFGYRPDKTRFITTNDRSIISSIKNRIAIDAGSIDIRHVRIDEDGRFKETINSGLNNCLNVEANIDQAAQAFRIDCVYSLLDKGVIAIVPVDTDISPTYNYGFDIKTLRVGEIVQWYPRHVKVKLYNDRTGNREEVVVPKSTTAIIENPLYEVMNEPNSTLQRLTRKLSLIDTVDEQASSGKLDIIIQLPYVIKSEARREQAETRRKDIEAQLKGSKYGIAYTDGTERITQLNRPAENNMLKQVEYLTDLLYAQLGLTKEVFDGTADEKTMLSYHNRTIAPLLTAITEGMLRAFITKTARTQGQSIEYYRDPFRLAAISDVAEIADKFTRNEIMTSNEVRSIIGLRPSNNPDADELRNKNLPQPEPLPVDYGEPYETY